MRKKISMTFLVILILCSSLFTLPEHAYGMNTVLRIGYIQTQAPIVFGEEDKPQGIAVDLMERIAEMNDYSLIWVPMKNYHECEVNLASKSIDAVIAVEAVSRLKKYALFSDTILESDVSIFISREKMKTYKDDRENSYVAIIADDLLQDDRLHFTKDITLLTKATHGDALNSFLVDKAPLLIGVADCVSYELRKKGIQEDYVILNNHVDSVNYYIAVRDDNHKIFRKINYSIRQIRTSGEYDKIYTKWIDENAALNQKIANEVLKVVLISCVLIFFVIAISYRIRKMLKDEVERKTTEIRETNEKLQRALTELRNSSELRKKVIEESPNAMIAVNREMSVTLMNQMACTFSGCTEPLVDKPLDAVNFFTEIMKEDIEKADDNWEEMEYFGKEVKINNADGDERIFRVDRSNLYEETGQIRGALFTITDVTDEINMKNQMFMLEKSRDLSQLVAEICHEILNPLTTIKTISQLIEKKEGSESFMKKMKEIVPKEVDRIAVLLRNLMDYTKPHEPDAVFINPEELLSYCKQLTEPIIKHSNITFNTELMTSAGTGFIADENQIKQVLLNLILNSIDSLKEKMRDSNCGSALLVSVHETKTRVKIVVHDEGMGMSKENIAKATTPFFTTKIGGTGLGLPVTCKLVEENGGKISIESVEGQWTKVTIEFDRKGVKENE